MADSKYRTIVRILADKIRLVEYPPGSKLPGYLTLARAHKVSAITSNRALAELERMGLVERRERSGTFVLDRPRMLSEVFVVVEVPLNEEHLQYLDHWRGVVVAAEDAGISIQTVQQSDPKFAQRVSPDRYVGQGLIFIGQAKLPIIQEARKARIPHVHLGQRSEHDTCTVLENRHAAAAELVRIMIEDGYRRIGFIGNLGASNHRLARDGYLEGIEPLGLGYRYIRDANEENVAEVTRDLLADDLGVDAVVVMGARNPIGALPVLLGHTRKPAIGVLTEDASILQLSKIAYLARYSQIETGKLAFELLNDLAMGKVTAPATLHPPFHILRPGEKMTGI